MQALFYYYHKTNFNFFHLIEKTSNKKRRNTTFPFLDIYEFLFTNDYFDIDPLSVFLSMALKAIFSTPNALLRERQYTHPDTHQ